MKCHGTSEVSCKDERHGRVTGSAPTKAAHTPSSQGLTDGDGLEGPTYAQWRGAVQLQVEAATRTSLLPSGW
jgi:hypothetical protein